MPRRALRTMRDEMAAHHASEVFSTPKLLRHRQLPVVKKREEPTSRVSFDLNFVRGHVISVFTHPDADEWKPKPCLITRAKILQIRSQIGASDCGQSTFFV